jgi:hypothetical protein
MLKVLGLPFSLWVYNDKFYKSDEIHEGAPVYVVEPYFLYGLIPIAGAKILKYQGIWVLWRNVDSQPIFHSIEENQQLPIGEWSNGVTVY